MAGGYLTEEERNILLQSPYIRDVSGKRVSYAEEFKVHFMQEYKAGKWPQQIFREAGLDVTILGPKRIERAAARWRASYEDGSLGSFRPTVLLTDPAETEDLHENANEQVKALELEVAQLKKQVSILCEACNLKELA